jgi:hypothetical protein
MLLIQRYTANIGCIYWCPLVFVDAAVDCKGRCCAMHQLQEFLTILIRYARRTWYVVNSSCTNYKYDVLPWACMSLSPPTRPACGVLSPVCCRLVEGTCLPCKSARVRPGTRPNPSRKPAHITYLLAAFFLDILQLSWYAGPGSAKGCRR